jgi:hypothetical protein
MSEKAKTMSEEVPGGVTMQERVRVWLIRPELLRSDMIIKD